MLLKGPLQIIEEFHQMFRRDRVQRLADMIVRGDALDLEKTAGIIAGAGLFHVPLETQERGALGEENGERRQREIGHGVLRVVAGARVRQRVGDGAHAGDEVIETGGLLHAPIQPVRGQKYQLQSCDNRHAPVTDLSHALAGRSHAQSHLP